MKRLSILLTALAMAIGNPAQAQTTGRAASAGQKASNDCFQWGIALVGLAVIGTVVGLTAATAASSPNTFSTTSSN